MFTTTYGRSSILLIALAALTILLSSFSLAPPSKSTTALPPAKKEKAIQEARRQQRLQKRHHRLYERFEKASNSKQRYRLQKKIRNVERQQDKNSTFTLGLISFLMALLTAIAAFLFTVIQFDSLRFYPPLYVLIVWLVALVGLSLAIVALCLSHNKAGKTGRGLSIAAIVINSIVVALGLAFVAAFSIIYALILFAVVIAVLLPILLIMLARNR